MSTEREEQLKDFDLWRKAVAAARLKLIRIEKLKLSDVGRFNDIREEAVAAQSYIWELERACSQGHNYLLWKLARDKR